MLPLTVCARANERCRYHSILGLYSQHAGLTLDKTTVPIGVLLIIYEARPDAMPQVRATQLCAAGYWSLVTPLPNGVECAEEMSVLDCLCEPVPSMHQHAHK